MTKQQQEWLQSKFGTTDIIKILGQDVIDGNESVSHRLRECLGDSAKKHAHRFYKYIPEDILSKILPLQRALGRQEAQATNLRLYGSSNTGNLQVFRDKARETSLKRYNRYNFNSRTPEENEQYLINRYGIKPLEPLEFFNNHPPFRALCLSCNKEFMCHTSENVVTVCPRCALSGETRLERSIADALEQHGFKVIRKYKPDWLISPYTGRKLEIDLFLPDHNVAFEINGAWSHNSGDTKFSNKPVDFHNIKSKLCLDNGIRLFHVWEHWQQTMDCVKYCLAKLNVFDHTYMARKLTLSHPKRDEVDYLLSISHKQGSCAYSYALGLYDGDQLIQVMTFRKHREGIEIARNATLIGTQVIGGIHRLFKHACIELKQQGYTTVITYADRDVTPDSTQSVYTRLGFDCCGDTGSSMDYYTHHKVGKFKANSVINRRQLQKQYLSTLFSKVEGWSFNPDLTEQQNLAQLGIYPIYNSGCWKYKLSLI